MLGINCVRVTDSSWFVTNQMSFLLVYSFRVELSKNGRSSFILPHGFVAVELFFSPLIIDSKISRMISLEKYNIVNL